MALPIIVIGAGGCVIAYLTWPLAALYGGHPPYGMGLVGTLLLEAVLTGIGTVAWAAIVGAAMLRGFSPRAPVQEVHGSGERINADEIADKFKSHW